MTAVWSNTPSTYPHVPYRDDSEPWEELAVCRTVGPDVFFPEPNQRSTSLQSQTDWQVAKSICRTCPVTAECLAAGLDEEFGVWGGTTPGERAKLRGAR